MGSKLPTHHPERKREYFICNNCGYAFYSFREFSFCPNCKKEYEKQKPTSPPPPPKSKR
jgi:rubrerythrin